jgi:hypothetical protein
LFLAEARAWEVASVDEGDDVDDYLVFVQDGIYDYGNDGCEVGFPSYFD